MQKIIWLSDIHLSFLTNQDVTRFLEKIKKSSSDAVWISGDIAQADTLIEFLSLIESEVEQNIYFVLGNHDYYLSSFKEVRTKIRKLCSESERLFWLNDLDVVAVSKESGLIGHDSWADGRFGDYENSELLLNDYILIWDFNPLREKFKNSKGPFPGGINNILKLFTSPQAKKERLSKMQAFADEAVQHIEKHLPAALEKYKHVYFLTHAPPFKEATLHRGKISDNNGLPHFSSKIVGETLIRIMKQYPENYLTILCGHTHNKAEAQILNNLTVFAAGAAYKNPGIQKIFEL